MISSVSTPLRFTDTVGLSGSYPTLSSPICVLQRRTRSATVWVSLPGIGLVIVPQFSAAWRRASRFRSASTSGTRAASKRVLASRYVDRIRAERPDAALPAVYLADRIVSNELPSLCPRLGYVSLVAGLNSAPAGAARGGFVRSWSIAR